jgi:hypothetical protein
VAKSNEDLYIIDNRQVTMSNFLSQLQEDNQETQSKSSFLNCFKDRELRKKLVLPKVVTENIMQEQYDSVRVTIKEFTRPMPVPNK